jgi:uncharacterized protein
MKPVSLVTLIALLVGGVAMAADDDGKKLIPSITVVGSDEVSAKPDMAHVQVGVVTQAPSAAKALAENTERMQKLFQKLTSLGIAEKDMQTSNFNVSPQHRHGPQGQYEPEIVGYEVSNQLSIKVRDLAKLGGLLDQVVEAGSNSIQGVSFSVAEPKPLQDQAREKAMADARRKAELYAKAAGVKLGHVLLIQETTPRLPQPMMFEERALGGREAVPVAPGEQEFSASITVTYAIE